MDHLDIRSLKCVSGHPHFFLSVFVFNGRLESRRYLTFTSHHITSHHITSHYVFVMLMFILYNYAMHAISSSFLVPFQIRLATGMLHRAIILFASVLLLSPVRSERGIADSVGVEEGGSAVV
jgi:hypothetical protein